MVLNITVLQLSKYVYVQTFVFPANVCELLLAGLVYLLPKLGDLLQVVRGEDERVHLGCEPVAVPEAEAVLRIYTVPPGPHLRTLGRLLSGLRGGCTTSWFTVTLGAAPWCGTAAPVSGDTWPGHVIVTSKIFEKMMVDFI